MTQTPPRHQFITTDDGTQTLFSEEFQEACHSSSGARAETLLHYIEGCEVKQKLATKKSLRILEIGFGLGIGFLTTLESLQSSPCSWSFTSLEIDRDLLEWFRKENMSHPLLKDLHWTTPDILELHSPNIHLTILAGDARSTLPTYCKTQLPQWDAIYQDAFSPKKNPALWTREWFELLKSYSASDVKLSTYSSSASVRKAMLAAGWSLQKGEGFGKKRSSTRASLIGETSKDILEQVTQPNVPALSDDNIKEFLGKS